MKQETCGAGGVYLSSGREKSGFRRVDFDSRPNQILEKSLKTRVITILCLFLLLWVLS